MHQPPHSTAQKDQAPLIALEAIKFQQSWGWEQCMLQSSVKNESEGASERIELVSLVIRGRRREREMGADGSNDEERDQGGSAED